jgi:hypothetical protein
MSILKQAADAVYAFRFLKLLTTPWEKTDAYKYGVIDDKGNLLLKGRERKDSRQKDAYTVFHRLVFNLKRILQKLPLGQTRLATYAAALYLIKENTGLDDKHLEKVLDKALGDFSSDLDLTECHKWFVNENKLIPGIYTLTKNIASIDTGEVIAPKGSKIRVNDLLESHDSIFGLNVYKVNHIQTNQEIFITNQDIER